MDGEDPRPSIATSFFTLSGYTEVYNKEIKPPREWPIMVAGLISF
jgi:hypothetical protein